MRGGGGTTVRDIGGGGRRRRKAVCIIFSRAEKKVSTDGAFLFAKDDDSKIKVLEINSVSEEISK